ncbi:uncharacterized protein FTOL_00839 [Fusarium torulosum]|uniref:Uncharacterized protein n=1 Tax=Fusarium torulosum TaxID=33205 RepID=A0AAE8LYV6_9HYPO|nr:uncharacterized protein FTOL_00839 [Fusarium torulosum]
MVAKAAYKARVVNHLVSNSPWMAITHVMNESKHFDTDKSRFHQELVSTFTEGLNLPSSITSDVEGVLAEIKQAITTANQSGNEANKLQFIIVLNVLKFDEMIGSWQSDVCAIYFRLDNSLSAYIRNKDETTKVTVSILYSHFNAQFGDRMFETKVKDSIQKFISDSGRVEGLSVDVSFDNGEYFRDKGW